MCKKLVFSLAFVLALSIVSGVWAGVSKPDPSDGAVIEETWANLAWQAGSNAASFDVYFGDDYASVKAGTGDTFRGNQAVVYFVVGFPGFPYPDGLVSGTTYYWRIDEHQNDGTVHKGTIWSFMIAPKTARDPSPADAAEFVDPNSVVLSWTPGFGAKLHTVYFGDDYDTVNNATGGTPQGTTVYNPGQLETSKVYFWRVDEFDAVETYKGDIWCFTTPGAVGNPQPANGGMNVEMNKDLAWDSADSAASHQLYFGTDRDAVLNADAGSPEYVGSVSLGDDESYDPGLLDPDTVYSWRVDEVDDQGNVSRGPLWSFTTGDFLLVEGFEEYSDDDAAGEAIWQHWIDGYGVAENGAQVGYLLPPYAEQKVVRSGVQAMPLQYENVDGIAYSEAELTLADLHDWTVKDVNTLTISFWGKMTNAAEPMYVSLNGGSPIYREDPHASQIPVWSVWDIDLQLFADQGVDLTNVTTIAIGFGDKSGAGSGSSGTVFFDDIRLGVVAHPVTIRSMPFEEDFEGVELGESPEESAGTPGVWTDTPPEGWAIDESGIAGIGDPAVDGVTDWAGWALADKEWWISAAGDQRRTEFTLGQGVVAVADPDEWDDSTHPDGWNVAEDPYDTWLSTPPIDISGAQPGSVQLTFDSSWRPEYDSSYRQTANITAFFNGQDPVEILLWESDSTSPNYKDDNSTNETITVDLNNPAGATSVILTFGLYDAGNDWWWAIDNIQVTSSP